MSAHPKTLTGGCLCGAVRYSCTARPLTVAVCHCDHCQRASGSAFSVNVVVKHGALTLTGDPPALHATTADASGDRRDRYFCAGCGSPVYTVAAELPDLAVLKAGTLDDRSWLDPGTEFFADSAQPWVLRREPRGRFARGAPIPNAALHFLRRRARRARALKEIR